MVETPRTSTEVLSYAAPETRVARPPRPPVVRISVFGLLLFPLVLLVSYPVVSVLPWGWDAQAYVKVTGQVPGEIGRAAFHVQARGTGRGRSTRFTHVFVVSSGAKRGSVAQLDADLKAMTYMLAYTRPMRPITHEALVQYISQAGFATDSDEASAVAAALLDELRKLSRGELPPDVTGEPYLGQVPAVRYSMSGTQHYDLGELGYLIWLPWYTPWCIPLWLLAWVLPARWLLRRHHRRLAGCDQSPR
jgi:hypothetical protein